MGVEEWQAAGLSRVPSPQPIPHLRRPATGYFILPSPNIGVQANTQHQPRVL